jgi:hypothetical protein
LIEIPVSRITDWESFHDVWASTLGFPSFYGRNMDAWIDCLTYVDEGDGMSNVVVADGDVLTLRLDEGKAFRDRCPDLYAATVECAAFVNWRRLETGRRAIIAVAFA